MDKFFLNDVIKRIWKEDFKENGYNMAKHLGHINNDGKVTAQKVNFWINNKAVIKPESFVETLTKLGYTFNNDDFSDIVKNNQI